MNVDDLTIGDVKKISYYLQTIQAEPCDTKSLNGMVGDMVIIRTYAAGVWFGRLSEKSGAEVILAEARRMWKWHAAKSISLSGCAIYGIIEEKSKIVEPVEKVWLEAVEIINCTELAINSIQGAIYVNPE